MGFAMTSEILEYRLKLKWRFFIIHSDGAGVLKSGVRSFEESVTFGKLKDHEWWERCWRYSW